jgi:hypothetical protein
MCLLRKINSFFKARDSSCYLLPPPLLLVTRDYTVRHANRGVTRSVFLRAGLTVESKANQAMR